MSNKPFRFGVVVSTAPAGVDWAEMARTIEGEGFSTLCLTDHFDDRFAPLSAAAFASACVCCAEAGDGQYFDRSDKITRGAGNAIAHNMAVQTVDPWPRYVRNNRINVDGKRIALGHSRYQANKSIPPKSLSTSNIQFGISNSGSSAGSDSN